MSARKRIGTGHGWAAQGLGGQAAGRTAGPRNLAAGKGSRPGRGGGREEERRNVEGLARREGTRMSS